MIKNNSDYYISIMNNNMLCICDLDGTLLLPGGRLSSRSKYCLNSLIENGANITIASARTPGTIINILDGLNIKLPVACMNGSVIYDINSRKFLQKHTISIKTTNIIKNMFNNLNLNLFIHCPSSDNSLNIYYTNLTNSIEIKFFNQRKNIPLKKYIKGNVYNNDEPVFLVAINKKDILQPIFFKLKNMKNIKCCLYKDVYNEDAYFLEIYNKKASKKFALNWLKSYCNAQKTIAFGDNDNDIPMLTAADISYAVSNGTDACKSVCDFIIESNKNDSVAKTIASIYNMPY